MYKLGWALERGPKSSAKNRLRVILRLKKNLHKTCILDQSTVDVNTLFLKLFQKKLSF